MTRMFMLVLFLAGTLCAADRTITWNPNTAELSWTSSTDGKTKFVINLRTRLMTANGKQPQRFNEEEQFLVMRVMMGIEAYILQSEDWHPDPEKWSREHQQRAIPQAPTTSRKIAHTK